MSVEMLSLILCSAIAVRMLMTDGVDRLQSEFVFSRGVARGRPGVRWTRMPAVDPLATTFDTRSDAPIHNDDVLP